MAVDVERRLFTVDEFDWLIKTGFFSEDERVELVNGELIQMAPIGSHHHGHVNALDERFREWLGRRVTLSNQGPVVLGSGQRPQPDLMLLQRRDDYYVSGLPTTADVLLVIEVADSSLAYDQQVKGLMYAEAGIQDYWILNLVDSTLLVYRQPTPAGYASVQTLSRGDSLTPLAFPELTVQVSDLLI